MFSDSSTSSGKRECTFELNTDTQQIVGTQEVVDAFREFDDTKEPAAILSLPGTWMKRSLRVENILDLQVFIDLSDLDGLSSIYDMYRSTTVGGIASLLRESPVLLSSHTFFAHCDLSFNKMLEEGMPPVFLSRTTTMIEGNIIDGNHRLIMLAYNFLQNRVKNGTFTAYIGGFDWLHLLNWNRGSFVSQYKVAPKLALDLAYRRFRSRLGR